MYICTDTTTAEPVEITTRVCMSDLAEKVNPIPSGLFEGGSAWEVGRGDGKCPRPITLNLLMIME